MKSVRLTKDLRQRILSTYLACYDASNPKPKEYSQRSIEGIFAENLRQRLFKNTKVDETTVPTEFFNLEYKIKVCLPDETVTYFYFYNEEGTNYNSKPCPRKEGLLLISENDPEYIAYKEAKRNVKQLNEAFYKWQSSRTEVAEQVRMALDSVNTTGQLLSVWPEAEKFIPSDVLDFSQIQLPSVSFNSLNKAVGI